MKLVKPEHQHIVELMSWFNSELQTVSWGGPHFNYPFTLNSFTNDLKLNELHSYTLLNNNNELVGFGQYYLRLGKCHLGRLVINPAYRGQGLSSVLISLLIEVGTVELNTNACSLFVYEYNRVAIASYQKLGFSFSEYPEDLALDGCLYMIT